MAHSYMKALMYMGDSLIALIQVADMDRTVLNDLRLVSLPSQPM